MISVSMKHQHKMPENGKKRYMYFEMKFLQNCLSRPKGVVSCRVAKLATRRAPQENDYDWPKIKNCHRTDVGNFWVISLRM